MYDEIRLTQRFNKDYHIVSSSFVIDLNSKSARFKEYKFDDDDLNLKFKDSVDFKKKTENKTGKSFALSDDQIRSVLGQIDEIRFTKYSSHNFRINRNFRYKIELLKNGLNEESIYINLKFQDELEKFNYFFEDILGFPVFDLSVLNQIVTDFDYEITRYGVYSKKSHERVKLTGIRFNMESGLFNHIIGWSVNLKKGIFKYNYELTRLDGHVIAQINRLIEDYGVYLWYFSDFYEKIDERNELSLDGPRWKLTLTFENGRIIEIRGSSGYPDTYPQLAFKIMELFGLDLLKSEYLRDLDLYYKYGDSKIRNHELIEDYILTEIVLRIPALIDFHIRDFPKRLWKRKEFIFEYDTFYDDEVQSLKEIIVSRLKQYYERNYLKYSFYIILYPVEYLNTLEHNSTGPLLSKDLLNETRLKGMSKKEKMDYTLDLWKQNRWLYLEFKKYCRKFNLLDNYFDNVCDYTDSEYVLSDSYRTYPSKSKIRIFLKKSGKKYRIVEYGDATHVLVQKLNIKMEIDFQKIYRLKNQSGT